MQHKFLQIHEFFQISIKSEKKLISIKYLQKKIFTVELSLVNIIPTSNINQIE